VRLTSKSRNRRTTATACAASPAQPAAAPKRSGAFSRSRPQPQPKKASRRKSTASDSFWRQTLDELTRKLAAAKAEAQRSATAVAPPAHAEAEGRVSESPSRDNDTACPSFPRDTKDLPGQASESESISQLITAPATQPATPPFTPTPAQVFPVQLRHPGPYGMSTGSAALSPQPEPPNIYTRARLIGSSAIRNFDKG
jgi:hypothetical protein